MVDSVLVDALGSSGDLTQLEKDLSQAVQSRKTLAAGGNKPAGADESSNDDAEAKLPPKLRGKTREQIADMYANLESSHGRLANDLGTQRKLTDRLLDLKRDNDLSSNGSPAKVEIKSSELLENPTEALERFSQARESQNEARLRDMETRLAAQALVQSHPDYVEVGQSPEFVAWVQSSSLRLRAAQAAQAGDWAAAGDLLTEYKEQRKAVVKDDGVDADDDEAVARKAAKQASLESNSQGNAGAKKGGKVYRRVDLMRLRAEKPDQWDDPDFQAEIIRAYNEGRVK